MAKLKDTVAELQAKCKAERVRSARYKQRSAMGSASIKVGTGVHGLSSGPADDKGAKPTQQLKCEI